MSRHRAFGIVGATILLVMAIGPAGTSAAGGTTITLTSLGVETFTATGGVICPSGTATTDFHKLAGGPVAGSFHLTKTLVCENRSGSFTIAVNAATVFGSPTDKGGWAVLGGTGAYATLHGGGKVVGTYVPGGIIDLYTGAVGL